MLTSICALSVAFTPAPSLGPAVAVRTQPNVAPVMNAAALGRRAALLGLVALPLTANADAIEEIAARNAEAAAAAKSPEALQAAAEKEEAEQNNALFAGVGIGALILGSSAISMAPVSENVKRVGDKVRTGKGRKY